VPQSISIPRQILDFCLVATVGSPSKFGDLAPQSSFPEVTTMMRATTLLIVLLISVAARAEQGAPSSTVLSDMGLADLQILTDREASAIRGFGFDPGSHLAGFEHYQLSKTEFKERVAEFRDRIKNHTFKGAVRFKDSIDDFHDHVRKFHDKVAHFKHKIH
jgi:hypothetical protein